MKKICRICIALFISLTMSLGGISWDAVALDMVSPLDVLPDATVNLSTTKNVIEIGDTQALKCSVIPTGGTTTFVSNNIAVARVDQYGVVTAINTGTATITARYSYNGSIYTNSVTITVVPKSTVTGIQNGTRYYIMNYSNEKLMGLQTASDANNTNVHVGDMNPSTRYQWVAEVQTDGKIQFINVYSPTKKCLNVTNGYNLDIYTDSNQSYQKFTVERVNDSESDYDGLYTIKNGNMYLGKSTANSVLLKSTLSSDCYWSFMAVPKQYAEFFCHEYPIGNDLFQTNLNFMYFRDVFNSLNYATSWSYENNSATAAYNCMTKRDDVFIFSGHGNAGMISFFAEQDGAGVCTGSISSSTWLFAGDDNKYISSIETNGLNHARAIIYFGCETGKTYNRNNLYYSNLVDETFEKGAHFVLGVKEVIYANHHNEWLDYFLDAINSGMNIVESVEYAKNTLGPITVEGVNYAKIPLYTRGDSSQYLAIT